MAQLVSPGVSVTIDDDSLYIPGPGATLPLVFIATADRKETPTGLPALGTYEHGVLRTVTSLRQLIELYGQPKFYETNGNMHFGDVRNEYGLDALAKYLEIGSRAYVVRVNVNLDDRSESIRDLWEQQIQEASDQLNELVEQYIAEYNDANDLVPADPLYKVSVNGTELKTLLETALQEVLTSYSFSTSLFAYNFIQDHTVARPGFQEVRFITNVGFLQETDVTGLVPANTYGADISVTHDAVVGGPAAGTTVTSVSILGSAAQTFGQLIDVLNDELGGTATAELISGRIRITSNLSGATSYVEILSDGTSGALPLFASLNLFLRIDEPIAGRGVDTLSVYDETYENIVSDYDGLNSLIDEWNAGSEVATEFTSDEAEGLLLAAADIYSWTLEFRSETSLGANDAQRRQEVVRAYQETVNVGTVFRGEYLEYDLLVAPGFPEVVDELQRLNEFMKEEVFVIGETPYNRPPTGPGGINFWSVTPARVTSRDVGYWYGHGISSTLDGRDVLFTSASTALRVIARSDEASEKWFAPAGTDRGLCNHLNNTGWVSGVMGQPNTFVEEWLDQGMRDELYEFPKNINPITFIPGRGILVLGQKTTSPITSAMDRINVSRLLKVIKRGLRKGLFPLLFEPNDRISRERAETICLEYLQDFIDRRGLLDFAVRCDETNNTPVRIDRNELWIDIALKPVKAIEFIYVPLRIVNTGADIGGGTRALTSNVL